MLLNLPKGENITLEAITNTQFLPSATSLVEKGASAFGIDEQAFLSITLATEEIFGHLSQVAEQDSPIPIQLSSGYYYVRADLAFQTKDFDMRAFNLTTHASFDEVEVVDTGIPFINVCYPTPHLTADIDERNVEDMGIPIVKQIVDKIFYTRVNNRNILRLDIKVRLQPLETIR